MSVQDHFSHHAADYARFRPRYPESLFAWLARAAPGTRLAWDCGTGNGQAAVALAEHFASVIATDPSAQQVSNATPDDRISYHVATYEVADLEDATVDLVTVAQALHWFDLDGFYAEVRRVLRPGGLLAAWTYNLLSISPELDVLVERYYRDVVGEFWPPERRLVEQGYAGMAFPFEEIEPPAFRMQATWTLDTLFGYLGTWSASQRYMNAHGRHPLSDMHEEIAAAWGEPATREVHWPLRVLAGTVPG